MLGAAPAAISAIALAICALAASGVARDRAGDEGTMAHVYQLLIVVQVPILAVLVVVAVRRGFRDHAAAVGAQLALFGAAVAAVPILGL
jgi:hypothetical protein